MKIDNSISSVPSPAVSEARTRPSEKAAANASAGVDNNVRLSGLSARLQSSEEAPSFDAARVAQIKQAIADGKFQINTGAIADRLISSARELVNSGRRA